MNGPIHLQEINRARDWYNPLRGLDIGRVIRLLDDAERGKYDELQKLNRMAEKRHPTLKALKERRLSALKKLTWDCKVPQELPAGITAAQAEQQRAFLWSSYNGITNLPQAIGFLALPTFRGYAHLEKHYLDDDPNLAVVELRPVPQWHWLRDPNSWVWKYDPNARHDLSRAVEIDVSDFIIREVDDPLCEIALLCFIRRNFAKKDWTAFMGDYGIPSIFAMLGENTPLDKVTEWLAVVKQVTSNSRGALPPGSDVKTVEAKQLDGAQFKNFMEGEDEDLVLAGTGGLLTMLTASTGMNSGQGDAHEETFDQIAQAEAMEINAILQAQFDKPLLEMEFPGQPIVAYFELAAKDEEDIDKLAERAVKFSNAGFDLDAAELSEKSGLKLTRKAAPVAPGAPDPNQNPDPNGKKPPFANRADLLASASATGRDARYMVAAQRALAAADQAALKPAVDRAAALLAVIDDDTAFEAGYRQLLADLPELETLCLGDNASAPLEKAFDAIIGGAMASGIATAAETRAAKPAKTENAPPILTAAGQTPQKRP